MAAISTSVMLALTALSAGAQAAGQIRQGNAARKQGEYQGHVFDENARIAELQAQDALARGQEDVYGVRRQVRGVIGSQRSTLAAQGIDIESGSALDVQTETVALGELDMRTIRNNAAREAWGYRAEAANLRDQGRLARMGGRGAQAASRFGAASTVLTAASDIYGTRRRIRGGY